MIVNSLNRISNTGTVLTFQTSSVAGLAGTTTLFADATGVLRYRIETGSVGGIGDATLTGTQTWTGINTFSPTTTLSTGSVNLEGFYPTVNQSGNAGYVARRVSVYEQATGSGSKLLLDLGTNSASNGGGTHTSKFSVDNLGLTSANSIFASANGTINVQIGQNTDTGNGNYSGIWFNQTKTNRLVSNYAFLQDGTNTTVLNAPSGAALALRINNAEYGKLFSTGRWFFGSSPTDDGVSVANFNGGVKVQGNIGIDGLVYAAQGLYSEVYKNLFGVEIFRVAPTTNNLLIGTPTDIPSSLLTLASTTKGFLPPRQTQAQRTAISSPAVGLIVYQTDATEGLYIYKSGGWTFII